MLLTELILAKRGPLAKVWLSAHHERKLSKQQALGVDVEESVDAILTQETEAITLRISGQLMLGVVRIYSRKVQYLMDDCKETRERISMAFRPGMVDLPEDQVRASKNAITFSETQNMLDWNFSVPEFAPRGLHTAPLSQTNLRPSREYGAFNFGRPAVPSIYGGSTPSRQGSHDIETSSHLDSGDFSGIDLGLDLDLDVEMAREAAPERTRSASAGMSRTSEVGDMFAPLDLGLDFDFDQPGPMEEDRGRRETSALSTPPPESPNGVVVPAAARPAAPKRLRVVRADNELELPDDEFAAPELDEDMNTSYISADPEAIRLQEIIADPASFFLPTIVSDTSRSIFSGPLGLAPELAELFTFPATVLRRDVEPPAKRARTEEDIELEEARRGSVVPPSEPFDLRGGFDMGDISGNDFDLPVFEPIIESTPRKSQRAPTPPESVTQEAPVGDHPLAAFDNRHRDAQGEFDSNLTESMMTAKSDKVDVAAGNQGGVSKNTALALGVLRRELESGPSSFEEVAAKASKRAASAFFFELLVLGTRDSLKLDQPEAYGEITISAKDKLWEGVAA